MSGSFSKDDFPNTPPPTPGGIESLLTKLEAYTPVVSDATTKSILQHVGVNTDDPQIVRLISSAAQKFISDVAYDALQHCKMRGGGKETKKVSGKDRKYALTTDDLGKKGNN
ncbi:transcription initiation factor TFIID subunit 10 [Eurytemora carolleeae]|uniref:transcription initiation factor TFIID subunit 10 n=1 Tax=Eurytemora carolleeae TaxID=1294199 RepID=UPI000C76F5E4|nr:transcription initiation factor TFIID subunit 10 [Eurytemora carolleeae]|eukprot:XP_023332774.1 transcription initiation factor TFIID subunit 10-like [Eurytemora affinis]